MRVLTVFGTRPEAIKLAPVILELEKYPEQLDTRVCVTAQHRQMLDQVLDHFGIVPDLDLNLMQPDQTLPGLTADVTVAVSAMLEGEAPDLVLVQGDTTTVMASALAAFYQRIPVGHVEAGLRSHDRYSPFPEEVNRRLTSVLTTYHYAPTDTARQALVAEGVDEEAITVTGNTVIDALLSTIRGPAPARAVELLQLAGLQDRLAPTGVPHRRLILVTAHRRENFGERLVEICLGLKALVERNPDVALIYPVHLNPQVQEPVRRILSGIDGVHLTPPVDYAVFAHLMAASTLILTDSGGIQEEAPALGKPVLVMRTETERPEAVEAGTAKLVGPDAQRIVRETERLLHDSTAYEAMAKASSPFGDGKAAARIVQSILGLLGVAAGKADV